MSVLVYYVIHQEAVIFQGNSNYQTSIQQLHNYAEILYMMVHFYNVSEHY